MLTWDEFETFTMVMGWACIVYFFNFTDSPLTQTIADEYAKLAEAVAELKNPNIIVAAFDSERNPPPNSLVFTEMHNIAKPPNVIIFPMNNKTLPFPFIEGERVTAELMMHALDTFADTDLIKWKKEKDKLKAWRKKMKEDL